MARIAVESLASPKGSGGLYALLSGFDHPSVQFSVDRWVLNGEGGLRYEFPPRFLARLINDTAFTHVLAINAHSRYYASGTESLAASATRLVKDLGRVCTAVPA